MRRVLGFTVLLTLATSCSPAATPTSPSSSVSSSAMPFSIDRLNETFSGRVSEVIDVSGYTYVRVVVDGESDDGRWVVSLKKPVVVGDSLAVRAFGTAAQFKSKQLDRTFDTLWFGVIKPTTPTSETTPTATTATPATPATTAQEPT